MKARPTLILQPMHNSSADIMRSFALARPLTPEQINFLDRYQKQLSSKEFDPILRYYLQAISKHRQTYNASFLLPHEILNAEAIHELKKRIALFLQKKRESGIIVRFTQKQFESFKTTGINELIFWHGNQYLTGAPFYPGGIPPVIYFQWGNLFGVVKYVVLSSEKTLNANILVYFEDMQDRNLNKCVLDYDLKTQKELEFQNEILYENRIEPEKFNEFLIKTPTLKL